MASNLSDGSCPEIEEWTAPKGPRCAEAEAAWRGVSSTRIGFRPFGRGTAEEESGRHEMTWLAWSAIALAALVTVLNAWMTWQRLADASRRPAEPGNLEEYPLGRRSKAKHHEPPSILGELDERGYLSRRGLQMGCEAAICQTPFGARIVAGKSSLEEPQYAWDYTSITQAHKALACAKFRTDPKEGIVVDEFGNGFYPAAEPRDYSRRWKYAADGQMQRF